MSEQPSNSSQPESRIPYADLIHQLRTSGIIDAKGYNIIQIDSTPHTSDQMFLDRDGHIVHGFDHKFTPEFTGWEPGDRIRSKFLIERAPSNNPSSVTLLVSDSVTGDIRHSDTFEINDLEPEDADALIALGVAELDANIRVTSKGTNSVSNMFTHKAELYEINGIQATFDGDMSQLEKGQQALVEGKVSQYSPKSKSPDNDKGNVTVELSNGKTVDIELFNGYLNFESGALEIMDPDYPVIGDAVQINATFNNPMARYGEELPPRLFAFHCRSTHLITPSDERQAEYDAKRQDVSIDLDVMERSTNDISLKIQTSLLIQSHLYDKGSFPHIALTAHEVQRARAILEAKFPNVDDRPIDLFDDIYIAQGINSTFGVDIYSMSHKDFFDFCMQVAQAEYVQTEDGDASYIYRIMHGRLSTEQQEKILQTAVSTFYSRVVGRKNLLSKPYSAEEVADPDKVPFHTTFFLDQSLGYLSSHTTESTAQVFLDIIKQIDKRNLFSQDHTHRLEFSMYHIFSAIERNIATSLALTRTSLQETGTITNKEGLHRYTSELPRLRALSARIKEIGWKNEGRYDESDYVDRVIDLLDQYGKFSYQLNAHLN